jgi:hypothetical protein
MTAELPIDYDFRGTFEESWRKRPRVFNKHTGRCSRGERGDARLEEGGSLPLGHGYIAPAIKAHEVSESAAFRRIQG